MHSCIYEGTVRHRRISPIAHSFRYPLFLMYLDLSELDDVFRGRWLWSTNRPNLAWFRRGDHLGDAQAPLDAAVRDLVRRATRNHHPVLPGQHRDEAPRVTRAIDDNNILIRGGFARSETALQKLE